MEFPFLKRIFTGLLLAVFLIGGFIIFKNLGRKPSYQNCNIILIHVVPLRADHLSCYGYFRETSPNLDKMARESIVFMNNFTPNAWTITSFMSLITSLYPASHGVFYVGKDKLSPDVQTLAQILQMYGYKTAWFGTKDEPQLDPAIGVGQGFETISFFPSDLKTGRIIILDWLENNKNKKFFLGFHSFYVHAPYTPSLLYKEKFTTRQNDKIIESKEQLNKVTFEAIKEALSRREGDIWKLLREELTAEFIAKGLFRGDFDQTKLEQILTVLKEKDKNVYRWACIRDRVYWSKIRAEDRDAVKQLESLYDATILEFDTEIIGPLIEKLKQLKLYDKTIIIFCGTHGEAFGEHYAFSHPSKLYEEVAHVPLIIRIPRIKGRRIQELTQTVDVMPTVLDLVGIPRPRQIQGKSLINLITGKNNLSIREYVFGQSIMFCAIRSKEWKLILPREKEGIESKELYHLVSDPKEEHNIYEERKDVALKLESEFRKWEKTLSSYIDREYPFAPEIDEATRERIKKTGYW